MSGLRVPVLVHAYPDSLDQMDVANRRDSFCGKISVCNNLRQYGFKYSLTDLHTVDPESEEFRADLRRFAPSAASSTTCQDEGGLNWRSPAFNTVRFSEKLLEANGISVEPIDLLEIVGKAEKLADDNQDVQAKLKSIHDYVATQKVPADALIRMAKFGTVIDKWMAEKELNASAIQCWNALEEYMRITPCTIMSMMSSNLRPSACETDVTGAVSMYILQLASGKPSALVDWNNNCVVIRIRLCCSCSNFPTQMFEASR